MRSRSLFGTKNILHLIYGLVCLLPMFSILGRTIYTQSNPNAKDSYSDTIIYENKNITNYQDLTIGTKYTLTTKPIVNGNTQFNNRISYISLTYNDLNITQSQYDNIDFMLINYTHNIPYLRFSNTSAPTSWIASLILTNGFSFDVIFDVNLNVSIQYINQWFYTNQIILTTNKMDNAFEYSISEFTKDNNLGNVDMFSWFTDIFLDQTNPKNALYIGFVNWYLNYTMLVSSGYLFFLVLIWFVNFVRRILEKSQNQDYGGF